MQLIYQINPVDNGICGAEVAELVDALGSGSSGCTSVGVRVSPSAPKKNIIHLRGLATAKPLFLRINFTWKRALVNSLVNICSPVASLVWSKSY